MADYFTPTVVQQNIPVADMTPLERFLLGHVFTAEPHGDGVYFYAEEAPADLFTVSRAALEAALAVSGETTGTAHAVVIEQLSQAPRDAAEVDLDLSGTSWEFIIQDIVRRSKRLPYVTAVASFTCSKMRPDGFGGMATLITATTIMGRSTIELIEEFLAEVEIDPAAA